MDDRVKKLPPEAQIMYNILSGAAEGSMVGVKRLQAFCAKWKLNEKPEELAEHDRPTEYIPAQQPGKSRRKK